MTAYNLPKEIEVEEDGSLRVIRLNRPDQLNATNHVCSFISPELRANLDRLLDRKGDA
jgi:enoyl-CoA hydratase/carnithine racemase